MDHRFEQDAATVDLARAVTATLRTIRTVREERAGAPTRAARLTLAAVHGATRLRRRQERETLDA